MCWEGDDSRLDLVVGVQNGAERSGGRIPLALWDKTAQSDLKRVVRLRGFKHHNVSAGSSQIMFRGTGKGRDQNVGGALRIEEACGDVLLLVGSRPQSRETQDKQNISTFH